MRMSCVNNGGSVMCCPHVGTGGCKNRPAPFPGQMSYKVTKPGSVNPVS